MWNNKKRNESISAVNERDEINIFDFYNFGAGKNDKLRALDQCGYGCIEDH